MLPIFGIELGLPVKVLYLRGDLYWRLGNVKRFNSPHATFAPVQPGPESFPAYADGRDTAHAGDDNSARLFELAQHLVIDQGGSGVAKHNIGLCAMANITKTDSFGF